MSTNLNKTKEEIIYELLLSLNNGNTGCADNRVEFAIAQYDSLIKNGIVNEICNHTWTTKAKYYSHENKCQVSEFKCIHCGKIEIKESLPYI